MAGHGAAENRVAAASGSTRLPWRRSSARWPRCCAATSSPTEAAGTGIAVISSAPSGLSEERDAPPPDRDAIMQRVRGENLEAFDRSIDVHISRIRAAIEVDPKRPRRIITLRGVGYLFARQQD